MATSPNYGWEEPDDTDLVKDGALSIRTMGNAIDSTLGTALNNKLHAGLVLVKTQAVGTGVSSVTVTSAFSTTYDSYRIIYKGGTGSNGHDMTLSLSGISSGYNSCLIFVNYGSSTVAGYTTAGNTYWSWAGSGTATAAFANFEIHNPYLSINKMMSASFTNTTGGGAGTVNGLLTSTTSATGFTLSPSSGTFTGGTIAVYGYAKD